MSNNNLKRINYKKIHEEFSKYKDERVRPKILKWKPPKITLNKTEICNIIVPFRDTPDHIRQKHLEEFIPKMSNFLKDYPKIKFWIITQSDDGRKFNRGALLNIGTKLAFDNSNSNSNSNKVDFVITHDVDLIPDEKLLPYYLASPGNKAVGHLGWMWKEEYNFDSYLGGVVSYNETVINKINGFPNNFYGWGGEDDSFYNRIALNNINIKRPTQGEYKSLPHPSQSLTNTYEKTIKKKRILNDLNKNKQKNNGLNSINYKRLSIKNITSPHHEVIQIVVHLEN